LKVDVGIHLLRQEEKKNEEEEEPEWISRGKKRE